MTTIKIKRASLDDLDKAYSLVTNIPAFAVSEETKFFDKAELKEWITDRKGGIALIAKQNEDIIGFLFAKIISEHYWCMLGSICVNPEYRNQGIGTKLLDYLYTILKKKGVDYVQALVDANQSKTRDFWKKRGFKEGNTFVWIEKCL